MQDGREVNAKSTEKHLLWKCREIKYGRANRKQMHYVTAAMLCEGGYLPMATRVYVNSLTIVTNGGY